MTPAKQRPAAETPARSSVKGAPAPYAVIELGTTSIRMVVAEIHGRGRFRVLDTLGQGISLGKDTFTRGSIERRTTEQCVEVLRGFRRALQEYGITGPRQIRAIATSAVREAANREAFLDRIYIATGIDVAIMDQAEVNRLTYLAVRPLLKPLPFFRTADTVVVEVGGGSTETLVFHRGKVRSSHMYRLGSLRLHSQFDEVEAPSARIGEVMQSLIDQTAAQIKATVARAASLRLFALGSEARLACTQLNPGTDRPAVSELNVAGLSRLTRRVLARTPDALVREYGITFQEAETLGTSLLVYVRLAKALKLNTILVGQASLRSGVLAEVATQGAWTAEYTRQIINSTLEVARKYGVDLRHARRVAAYAQGIFQAMQGEHQLEGRHEAILTVAALLHETGLFVSSSSHHKHSMYLILNSDIFGLGSRDLMLTALVARYHRRAHPKPTHAEYTSLERDERIAVAKLAAILRMANALDRGPAHRAVRLEFAVQPGELVVQTRNPQDYELEKHRILERAMLFKQVYGMDVAIRGVG